MLSTWGWGQIWGPAPLVGTKGRFGEGARAGDVSGCVGVMDLGNVHGLRDSLLQSSSCVKGCWMDCIPSIPLKRFFLSHLSFLLSITAWGGESRVLIQCSGEEKCLFLTKPLPRARGVEEDERRTEMSQIDSAHLSIFSGAIWQ